MMVSWGRLVGGLANFAAGSRFGEAGEGWFGRSRIKVNHGGVSVGEFSRRDVLK